MRTALAITLLAALGMALSCGLAWSWPVILACVSGVLFGVMVAVVAYLWMEGDKMEDRG